METIFDFEQPITEIDKRINNLRESSQTEGIDLSEQIKGLEKTRDELKQKIYSSLSPWQRIQIARHPQRPYSADYIKLIFKNFTEVRGDRVFGDDQAILCGIAEINDKSVVVIGHQKGRSLEENMNRNFGMAHPEGYRKALRVMKLAEKFNRPIITFIDTPGAYPGIAAEERGQAEAIARNLREMSDLKILIITVVIGEGGSGGALGIGVSNRVLCLENAYYSVISPEGCAAILFRDGSKAPEAAKAMKLTAKDLLELKAIDEIIKEPLGGAHYDSAKTAANIKTALNKYLNEYEKISGKKIAEERYAKFRNIGIYEDISEVKKSQKKAKEKSPKK
ncbi:acetyl-coenzyme A carboxylase carboxyl transferase subunit alpha [Endomicrobiia bacterium]|nr:acetyl-coenzyme A carboxylase carboxyl transferase subunit alpha [Endomicrobiia bacterium]GHT66687.1 acetyl-coenzyme A carboxylase carboxyl transferase subunit alpha [Endomicrobiia bacterium]GHT71600.1 acetyl-coenzyme A carboxylase carboxyl transferase subunit alpha [Endomicrobiia bacterium]GHT76751.1 acetyl-coenzyme A carboxylase carboxyl transferase subunit alpha [Endomicrobiia bacterium]